MSNKFCVYDRAGDYFPTVEADEVEVTDTGVTFYNDHGELIAHFYRDFIGGFQPEDEKPKMESDGPDWAEKVRKRYTCPSCAAFAPFYHNGKIHCRVCGKELE